MSHRAYQMYAHITWHTWCRRPCIDARAADDVHRAIREAGRRTEVRDVAVAVLADHVHVLVSFTPQSVLSDFVRIAKSAGALMANRRVVGSVKWARGFCVATIHKSDLARVAGYIRHQFDRHPDLVPRTNR
jgi:putative transposase